MFHPKRCIGIVLALSSLALPSAEAQPAFYVRAGVGIASQSLGDWNDDIRNEEELLQSAGLPADFETMGPGFPIMGEIGLRITELVRVGLLVSHQWGDAKNSLADPSGSLGIDRRASATTIAGTIAGSVGSAGFLLGADLGVALGSAEYELHFRDFADPANDLDIDGEWDGNAFSGAVYLGFDRGVGGPSMFARLGYRFQNLGKLDGGYTSPQLGVMPGPPLNLEDQPMDTDTSGVFLLVGIGFGG